MYGEVRRVRMSWGQEVAVNYAGDWSRDDLPVFVTLHGWGAHSWSRDQRHMWAGLQEAGWRVVAVDHPGFGRTPGRRWCSRSETNLDRRGPIQITHEVLMQSGIVDERGVRATGASVVVMGWSWGGGIACSMTEAMPRAMTHLVLYNASYTDHRGILPSVRVPTYVLWWKCDLIHPLALGEQMGRVIPRATFEATDPERKYRKGDGLYSFEPWSFLVRPLLYRWLRGQGLGPLPPEAQGDEGRAMLDRAVSALEAAGKTKGGARVMRVAGPTEQGR